MNKNKLQINEAYNGPLYHYTNLASLYSIIKSNKMIGTGPHSVRKDELTLQRKGANQKPFICFTRDKQFNIKKGLDEVICVLTFNAEKLLTIRNARLYPINYFSGNNEHFKQKNPLRYRAEAEERLFVDCITPFDKFVERIDIFTNNIEIDDSVNDYLSDEEYEQIENIYGNTDIESVNKYVINQIANSNVYKGRIFIDGQNPNNQITKTINETTIKNIVRETLYHLLENMQPQPQMHGYTTYGGKQQMLDFIEEMLEKHPNWEFMGKSNCGGGRWAAWFKEIE
jgi:hypothetical protein